MPQMMPINWILSFMFFIIIFILFIILNYYIFINKNNNSLLNLKKNTKNFIWKW